MDKHQKSEEKQIDLLELANIIWNKRRLILISSFIGLLIGVVFASSIPKTYTTTVTLAPEETQTTGSMSTIAALTGINISGSNNNLLSSPELFPTILNSTSFLMGLFDIKVQNQDNSIDTTLYAYLKDYQKTPWWSSMMSMPSKALSLFSKKENTSDLHSSTSDIRTYIKLSREEVNVLNLLKSLLVMSVDKKTNIVNLSSTMQDPKISAYITDTVIMYFQEYVINYRSLKSRQDLGFAQKLFDETKSDYYKKQQELASYSDANIGIISAKYATTKERLQNEVNLAYNMYNQMAQELQKTKIKVQDTTPVYTIIEPSVEPLFPSAPNKKMIILVFVLIFSLGASICVLVKHYLMNQNREM